MHRHACSPRRRDGCARSVWWHKIFPSTMRFASRRITSAKHRRRVTDGSEDEVVGGLAGLSWKELVGTWRTHRAEKTPLRFARFNYKCQPSSRNMRTYKHINKLFSDYLSYRHKLRHSTTRSPAPQCDAVKSLPSYGRQQHFSQIMPAVNCRSKNSQCLYPTCYSRTSSES